MPSVPKVLPLKHKAPPTNKIPQGLSERLASPPPYKEPPVPKPTEEKRVKPPPPSLVKKKAKAPPPAQPDLDQLPLSGIICHDPDHPEFDGLLPNKQDQQLGQISLGHWNVWQGIEGPSRRKPKHLVVSGVHL